jgi:predicted O-linked N-acetylglucosamine transferase (SPINDLY family)
MNARAMINLGVTSTGHQKACALWQRGVEAAKRLEWTQAIVHFERACKASPQDTLYRLNLARALVKVDRLDEAITHTLKILEQDPSDVLARRLAGECLVTQGSNARAADVLLVGRSFAVNDFDYLYSLGMALLGVRRHQDAIAVFMDAIALRVDHAQCFYQLAMCFHGLHLLSEAVECLETVQVLGVEDGEMACDSLLAFIRRECCDWEKGAADLKSLIQRVHAARPDEDQWISVFGAMTLTDDAAFQLKAAQIGARHVAVRAKPLARPRLSARRGALRLGFVSGDFHHHATTILMAELLERLDRNRFEVHLYSHGPDDGSEMRDRIKAAANGFVEVGKMNDREAAEKIQADGVDVLIDLKGHTSGTRLGIFAWRPAPIQVTYLGFPGTTGADYIDYMVGDETVSPLAHAGDFTEKLALLPHSYQPNDRHRPLPQPTTRAEHGLPDDALVLCGFNQPFKISAEVMDVWCGLLHELPHAVLWLLKWNGQCEAPLRAAAVARGIAPERLIFAPALKNAAHLSRFALADLYLDAWPCNGHTTVSDALWAGVPVVTLQGRTFVARVAASLLKAVGLPQGITGNVADYRSLVLRLAGDHEARQRMRASLQASRATAPLFDTDRYALDFAALIERMVARAVAGLPTDHLAAQSAAPLVVAP